MSRKRKGKANDDDEYEIEAEEEDVDDWQPSADSISQRARKRASKLAGEKEKGRGKGKAATAMAGDEEDDGLPTFKDFSGLPLKSDHQNRPLWVCPTGHIYLEASSPIYQKAYDFMVAIAEPVSRPELVHEYRLTPYSLYAAVAVGIDTETIINALRSFSKVEVPDSVNDFIRECTVQYGKAKLVLKHNRFYIESRYPEVLRELLRNPTIAAARVRPEEEEARIAAAAADAAAATGRGGGAAVAAAGGSSAASDAGTTTATSLALTEDGFTVGEAPQEMDADRYKKMVAGDDDDGDDQDADVVLGTAPGEAMRTVSFQVRAGSSEAVKRAAIEMDYPLMEEYDFRNDVGNPNVQMDLRPGTKIRPYQSVSLNKMFGNGRARSGIIVLPCGAGKTLTGVTAASTVKKSCLVLCTSSVSVLQWKHEFQKWTDIPDKKISCFTSDVKDKMDPECGVLISTYTMIGFGGKRSLQAQLMIDQIRNREWGSMLLDEVHVVPAKMFRKVLSVVNAHCKLGLTATLVREDALIEDLNFLIGPKLYEANWMDLTNAGFLANVQCVEAWCPMTAEFFSEYLSEANNSRKRELLYIMNPTKFRTAEFLLRYHQERGDKVILFADNVFALKTYATLLGIPFIFGETRDHERQRVLGAFKNTRAVNCIGLSKVGDTSIDIPEANVIIQISSHFGSRRQEAQRLGRILRPKASGPSADGFNAFFYTLVSTDTSEMYYSAKRQQYLVDQGYTFKVVTDLVDVANTQGDVAGGSKLPDKRAEVDLLRRVLSADTEKEEEAEDAAIGRAVGGNGGTGAGRPKVRRKVGSMDALSGGDGTRYIEYSAGSSSAKNRHPLFKRRYIQVEN